jgi:NADH:ubiquinone oxidoreductase subunit F (NADH-binding)
MSKTANILKKISEAGLVGRGGASYPTAAKWAAVKTALKNKKPGYIIVNGAEGEPGVKKDAYIFHHHAAAVINGVYLAEQFFGADKIKKIYIFLNREYYQLYSFSLKTVLADRPYRALGEKTEFFIKPDRLTYISGEETALLNLIEGKKVEPRRKPPYPTEQGLYGRPTLINNPETFYNVSLAAQNRYEGKRFYTISGLARRPGVYDLPANLTVEEILRQTGNYPAKAFFVQVGGGASGEIFNDEQLSVPAEGAGSIMIYDKKRTDWRKLFKHWLSFYQEQSCGQCAICREGSYRLRELMNQKQFNHKLFDEIVQSLEDTSFCGLGSSMAVPLKSYFANVKN